jgi:hypothetical protein
VVDDHDDQGEPIDLIAFGGGAQDCLPLYRYEVTSRRAFHHLTV